jgi:hypothetical protein
MSKTIEFVDYSPLDAVMNAITKRSPGASAEEVFVGPSMFDVPNEIELEILQGDNLRITFAYPNHERPESSDRKLSDDSSVTARLGEHTRKVLELRVRGASETLKHGGIALDTKYLNTWAESLPAEARSACVRNFEVIGSILRSLPPKVQRTLLDEFDSQKQKPR